MERGLRETVEAQARARAAGDMAAFASHMTAQALLQLREPGNASTPRRPARYEIVNLTWHGDTGTSEVRFGRWGGFALEQRWERRDSAWIVVAAACLEDSIRPSLGRRLLGAFGRAPQPPSRRDLE